MKNIGRSFVSELKAAGLFGLAFSWEKDGTITFGSTMPQDKVDAVRAVYDAHDPLAIPPEDLAAAAQAQKDLEDVAAAKSYAKLTALKSMTPAEIQAWVAANVTNLAQAQDAITTLAVAVGILARRL